MSGIFNDSSTFVALKKLPFIYKIKVNLAQAQVTLDTFGYPVVALWFSLAILLWLFGFLWLSCCGSLVFLLPKTFKLLGFPFF
jgi:hypothetical protein